MHTTHQPHSTLVATFLQHLQVEEQLLTDALATANAVHAALRRGDPTTAATVAADQQTHANALLAASAPRAAAAAALAEALGLPSEGVTLRALADVLPPPFDAEVREARERLAALTTELATIQARNANLLGHLRSFFRSVLADLTADDTPARYGPSGNWLAPPPGSALLTRGNHQ